MLLHSLKNFSDVRLWGFCVSLFLVGCTAGQVGWDYPPPVISDVNLTTVSVQNTQVDIRGSGFLAGAQVMVGQTSCLQVTYVSPTELICTLPPNTPVHNGEQVEVINADSKMTQGAVPPRPALALAAPAKTIAGQCNSVLVGYQDATGKSALAPADFAVTLGLSPSSSNAGFYSDSGCSTPINGFTFLHAQGSATFYFKDTLQETLWIIAQAPTLLQDLAQVSISVGPAATIALEGLTNQQLRACTPVRIWVKDLFGNHTVTASALSVLVSTSSPLPPETFSGTLYTNTGCTVAAANAVTIPAGSGFIDIYGVNPNPQTWSISVGATINAVPSVDTLSIDTIPFWAWWGGTPSTAALSNFGTTPSPGGRYGAATWVVSNNNSMWLFGGNGYDSTSLSSTPYLNDLWKYDGTAWTVMSGNTTQHSGQTGNYAVGGAPGGREGAVALSDGVAGAWLFGGDGCDAASCSSNKVLNDLWRYDGAGVWTFQSGSSSANSAGNYTGPNFQPMARTGASGWITPFGAGLYFFGGQIQSLLLNDVWSFDPTGGTWTPLFAQTPPYGHYDTFPPASPVYPGGRKLAATWTVSQNQTWMFGGWGNTTNLLAPAPLNDVWVFNNSSSWFSVMGQTSYLHPTSYGTQNLPAASNWPGPRYGAVTWVDTARTIVTGPTTFYTLWLYGGFGSGADTVFGQLSDLWMAQVSMDLSGNYNIIWTWVAGPQIANTFGVYGSQGVADASFGPGGRQQPMSWLLPQNQLFLFGGDGYDTGHLGLLNDIWQLGF